MARFKKRKWGSEKPKPKDIENKETIRDVSFQHSVIGVPNLGYENYTDYEIKIEYRQHYDSK